jgi:thioredoxin reductase (NADPH)
MYDVIIIGAGAAGLSAALWCDDLKLSALILEEQREVGGQLLWVYNAIQNYPGAKAKNGRELRDAFASQLADRKFNLRTHSEIESVDLRAKQIKLRSGEQLQATSLIIATGVRRRNLQVPGEKEFAGRGVFESATREREQMAGRDVCVVGGGDAAAENALLLAQVCPNVTLVHRGEKLRARREFIERLRAEPRVKIFTKAKVQRIVGAREVEGVEILIADATKSFVKDVRGVLVRIGVEPNTELFRGQVEFDEKNYIVVTSMMETNIRNVFAAGDVSNPLAPTISGATGAGATAAKAIAARRQESARNS